MDKYDILANQIDWKKLLIANYKNIDLTEEEVMVILVAEYCIEQNEKTITPDLLSIKMKYDTAKISEILTCLSNKSLLVLEEDNEGKLFMSLKGIKRILIDDFMNKQNQVERQDEEESLYSIFETSFGRPLSFAEVEMIKTWMNEGYEVGHIKLALQQAMANKVKNMRYIDKILLSWRQQSERKQEGYSTISESWRKDITETLEEINKNDK